MLYRDLVNLLFQRPLPQKNVSCFFSKIPTGTRGFQGSLFGLQKTHSLPASSEKSSKFFLYGRCVKWVHCKKNSMQHTGGLGRLHQMLKYYTAQNMGSLIRNHRCWVGVLHAFTMFVINPEIKFVCWCEKHTRHAKTTWQAVQTWTADEFSVPTAPIFVGPYFFSKIIDSNELTRDWCWCRQRGNQPFLQKARVHRCFQKLSPSRLASIPQSSRFAALSLPSLCPVLSTGSKLRSKPHVTGGFFTKSSCK